MIDLPELTKQIRRGAGLTQAEFAEALGVTAISVSRYENGTSKPGRRVLSRLRDIAFRVEPRQDPDTMRELERMAQPGKHFENDPHVLYFAGHGSIAPKPNQSLLDIKVLASLSDERRAILEAVLVLLESNDDTGKRVLEALVRPLLNSSPTPPSAG